MIAAVGMGGALFFIGYPQATLVYMAFVGACLGFLRYNFNPASVFLGDTGSMFLGFFLSTVPLLTRAGDSFLVGIGVPLLAMGVPKGPMIGSILHQLLSEVCDESLTNSGDTLRNRAAELLEGYNAKK